MDPIPSPETLTLESLTAYSYEGQTRAGRHRYSVCLDVDPPDGPHECFANAYGKTEDEARERAELIAEAVKALATHADRITQLAQERDEWKRLANQSSEKHVSVAGKLGDSADRIAELEAQVSTLSVRLRDVQIQAQDARGELGAIAALVSDRSEVGTYAKVEALCAECEQP